jgi:hypothetical protein
LQIQVEIFHCFQCRHSDHSGAFTTGGARNICGHPNAAKIRASKEAFKAEYPKYWSEKNAEGWHHWSSHWYHRITPNTGVPDWCPLKGGSKY